MKAITHIILCNTQTPEGQPVTPQQIIDWHTQSPQASGKLWNRPGFDVLIGLNGELHTLINENDPTPEDLWGISSGKHGLKGTFRYIAYVGGKTASGKTRKDTLTPAQEATLAVIVNYYIKRFPQIVVAGLGALPNMGNVLNPGFDVPKWLRAQGIPKAHHYIPKQL